MRHPLILRGPILSLSGYGYHCRAIFNAVFDSLLWDTYLVPVGWGGTSTTSNFSREFLDKVAFAVQRELPETLFKEALWVQLDIPSDFKRAGKVNVGITAGVESDGMSDVFVRGASQMNGNIVPSTFIRDLFVRCGVQCPTQVVFEPYDEIAYAKAEPMILEIPTKFNFLCAGQWGPGGTGKDRKNIGLLISEFLNVYKDNKDVGLILKVFSKNVSSADRYVTQERILDLKGDKQWPKIYLIHGDMTEEEMWGLYKSPQVHCFVSPTHGEGFGLPLLDAAVAGIPIITTRWSGHLDFLDPDYTTLLDYTMDQIPPTMLYSPIWLPGMRWAVPDVDQLRRALRLAPERYGVQKPLAEQQAIRVRNGYTTKVFREALLSTLDLYQAQLTGSKIITLGG